MITFQDTYDSRKNEIENFLELMKFLEQKENEREDGKSKFSEFFYPENGGIHLTYQALINILKSNVSLMIYNIIEYTVTNLIDSIYDEIRINHLSYIDVNDSIRSLWRKTILKSVNDPNANFSTFLKKNEEIISAILSNNELNMYAKNTLPGGNLDGNSIKETFESHGIRVRTNSRNYRPDILIGRKKDSPQKAALRELMGNYLKENNVKVKDGTDVNSIMRDMMSIILEGALDQELDP